jgi:glycosyltransferase involved in cell wall biosynthesis
MDLILTSSKHSKDIFETSNYVQKDQAGNIVKEGKLLKPVEVLFEGVDLSKYHKTDDVSNYNISDDLKSIKENFCFLFVGHWLQGDFGEDRKNVGYLIKAFLEVFKNKKNKPALVLKVSQGAPSIMDRDKILKKIDDIRKTVQGNIPNIYLIHGDLLDNEMNCLYNHPKIKAMISFTKGEGFGRPLLEFSITGKPIIASGWSGHLDFLTPNESALVGGVLTNVHPSAATPNMLLQEAQWFKPDDNQVGYALNDVFDNYKKWLENGKKVAQRNKNHFSFNNMTHLLDKIIEEHIPKFPKIVELKLPTLKKINNG